MLTHVRRILPLIPTLVVVLIALFFSRDVLIHDLSRDHLSVFGMFSSLDSQATRKIEAVAEVEGKRVQLDLEAYERDIKELRVLPSEVRLRRFLFSVACPHAPPEASRVTVRYLKLQINNSVTTPVEVWRGSTNDC